MTDADCSLADAEKLALADRLVLIEPVITAHLSGLMMDTDEDNALLDQIRAQWAYVLTGSYATTSENVECPDV